MRTRAHDHARARVVEVARSWIGTPFHDCAGLKGVGVDCAHLLERVYVEAGVMEPLPIDAYAPSFYLHRDEERFVGHILRRGREIAEDAVETGDMVLFRFGRCYAHGAIVADWPTEIVHALKQARCVLTTRLDEFGLAGRPARFFTLW